MCADHRLLFEITANVVVIVLIHLAIGILANKQKKMLLRRYQKFFRPFHWEKKAFLYNVILHISFWKDSMPDLPRRLSGGFSKGRLLSRDISYLREFESEIRFAQIVHVACFLTLPFFLVVNHPCLRGWVFAGYVISHLPALLIQRFNHPRLLSVLKKCHHHGLCAQQNFSASTKNAAECAG